MSGTANHLFGFKTNRVSGYFEPIEPTKADQLVLPKNFKYDVIAAFDDVINPAGENSAPAVITTHFSRLRVQCPRPPGQQSRVLHHLLDRTCEGREDDGRSNP